VDVVVEPVSGLRLVDAGLDSEPVTLDQAPRNLSRQIGTLLFAQFVWQRHLELPGNGSVFSALCGLGCGPELPRIESPVRRLIWRQTPGFDNAPSPSIVVPETGAVIDD